MRKHRLLVVSWCSIIFRGTFNERIYNELWGPPIDILTVKWQNLYSGRVRAHVLALLFGILCLRRWHHQQSKRDHNWGRDCLLLSSTLVRHLHQCLQVSILPTFYEQLFILCEAFFLLTICICNWLAKKYWHQSCL